MSALFKPPLQRILEEVNRLNPLMNAPVNPNMVEVVSPELFSANGGATNTRAILRVISEAIPVQWFQGERTIYYTRLNLNRVLAGLVIPGSYHDYQDSRGVVTALRERWWIPIADEDVALTLANTPEDLTLIASVSSVGYIGTITLSYEVVP